MQKEDCNIGLVVTGNQEANTKYTITIEGVVLMIDDIDECSDDDIHVISTGTQSREEVLEIINNNPCKIYRREFTDDYINELFNQGYWVNSYYFKPYQKVSKTLVSLSSYIM